jgi:hypothetical protein
LYRGGLDQRVHPRTRTTTTPTSAPNDTVGRDRNAHERHVGFGSRGSLLAIASGWYGAYATRCTTSSGMLSDADHRA